MSHVLARLESLERRVAALEVGAVALPGTWAGFTNATEDAVLPDEVEPAEAFAPPAPAGRPPFADGPPRERNPVVADLPVRPVKRSEPVRPQPRPVQEPRAARDLETWLGSVVLGRVGIAAVVLAAAYFAQLAYRNVNDTVKVLSLYALAGALVAVGRFLRPRIGERYVALLWGGGIAVAYIAGLAATLRYGLVDSWSGLILLAAAAALGQVLSRSLRNEVIATVSLASAVVAPFLLGVAMSSGLLMLAYAAGIYLWAAWTESAWGWRVARGVALFGAAALGLAWWVGPNLGSTRDAFLAMHGFALALLAPDLLAAWRGTGPRLDLTFAGAIGLAVLDGALLIYEQARAADHGVRGGGLLAGALWLGMATALAGRAREPAARHFVRMLATVGGLAVVLGTSMVWQDGKALPWATLLSLAVLAPFLLFLRKRVGAGDIAAFTAAFVALVLAADRSDWLVTRLGEHMPHAWLLLLVALVPAAALVGAGQNGLARIAGLGAGAATLGFALLAPALHLTHAWAAAALLLPATWAVAAHVRARQTGDRALGQAAAVLALGLGVLWVCTSLRLDRAQGWPGVLDPHTLSALGLAGVALFLRARGFVRREGLPVDFQKELMAVAVGLVLLAGGRDVHLHTRDLAATTHSAALALYGALAGVVLALHARTGNRLGRAGAALACLMAASGAVLVQGVTHGLDGAFVWALLGTGLATTLAGEILSRREGERPEWLGFAVGPFFALALAWVITSLEAADRIPLAIENLRFAGGIGLTALLASAAWLASRAPVPPALRWTLGTGALVVGYLAGLFELLQATHDLQAAGVLEGAWGPVLVSLYTVMVAGGMLFVGFRWKLAPLRYAALLVLGVVVAKVGLYDLAASRLPLRVLVTGVLGLVLLSGAYAYTKRRRSGVGMG